MTAEDPPVEGDSPPDGPSDAVDAGADREFGGSVGAPLVGLVAGGVALVALFAPADGTDAVVRGFPAATVTRAAAVVVVATFALGRQDVLSRRLAGGLAILASLVVIVGDFLALAAAITVWPHPGGVPVAAPAALVAAGMGLAEIRGLDDEALVDAATGIATAAAIGTVGFFVGNVGAAVFAGVVGSALGLEDFGARYVLVTIGLGVAFLAYGLAVLGLLDQDRSYLDLRTPSLRDLGVAVVAIVALLATSVVLDVVVRELGIPVAESQVERRAVENGNAGFILFLIPLSYLAIAPGEELVFRNVVQKYLYGPLTRWGAIVAASGIFAGMHYFQYLSATPGATVVSLTLVFALALILGVSYERTDTLVVPILVHGTFNALSFWGMYTRVSTEIAGTLV